MLFSKWCNHIPQDSAYCKKPLCCSANIIQAHIIQQNLLHNKCGNLPEENVLSVILYLITELGQMQKTPVYIKLYQDLTMHLQQKEWKVKR